MRGENIANFETARQTKDGRTIAVSMTISPVKNLENAIIGTSEILRDITEQKLAEERIALLGREAEHRTKNILAVVQAMIALSRSDTPDGLKKALEGRIQALANAHALLVHSRWLGAELSALAAQELAPYLNDRTRARIDGPRVLLEPNTAQAIAVILHELTTNAVKYGALSVRDGHVHLHWSHAENGPLTIRWTETGGPRVEISKHDGVGTRVMDHTVRGLLNGQMHIDWLVQGIRCELTIKI